MQKKIKLQNIINKQGQRQGVPGHRLNLKLINYFFSGVVMLFPD